MAFETKDMSGSLFPNERKEEPKQPDFTGKVMVNGEELRIAAWKRQSKNGKPYLSLKFSTPREGKGYGKREESDPFA